MQNKENGNKKTIDILDIADQVGRLRKVVGYLAMNTNNEELSATFWMLEDHANMIEGMINVHLDRKAAIEVAEDVPFE